MARVLDPMIAPSAFSGNCRLDLDPRQDLQAGQWVQLQVLPQEWSGESALLLCQSAPQAWVAWIPGHGEATVCLDALGEICLAP